MFAHLSDPQELIEAWGQFKDEHDEYLRGETDEIVRESLNREYREIVSFIRTRHEANSCLILLIEND